MNTILLLGKFFLLNLFFVLSMYVCAQEENIVSISDKILYDLKLKEIKYYDSLEDAINKYEFPINAKIIKYPSDDNQSINIYYVLFCGNYTISFLKRPFIQRYCLNSIEIILKKNDFVNSLFPYKNINQYKNSSLFGKILLVEDNKIIYEVKENWEYITLSFEKETLSKLTFVFHTE